MPATPPGLRVVALADAPAALPHIADWLHHEWFAAWGLDRAASGDELRRRLQRGRLPIALAACAGPRACGTVSLVEDVHPLEARRLGTLAGLYVPPRWRGRGIGAALCDAACATAAALGIPTLGLYTWNAEAYYRRLGWRKQAEGLIDSGDGRRLGAYLEITTAPWASPRRGRTDAAAGSIHREMRMDRTGARS